MELFVLLAFYVLGFITGVIVAITVAALYGAKMLKDSKTKSAQTSKKPTVSDRLKRVKEITSEQLDLAQQADGPQKNGLDGKFKNNITRQIKLLDEEKNGLLVSLIEDGHDPELTTVDSSGTITKMKLSEYMAYMGIKMPPKKSAETPKTERAGKFTIVKGGKGDGGGNTTH